MRTNSYRKSILISFFIVILGCLTLICFRNPNSLESDDCVKIGVSFFPFSYKPIIKIKIQDVGYKIMLDTGSSHALDLHARVLEQIQEKKFNKIVPYYDVQGKAYPVSEFFIPEIVLHKNLRLTYLSAFEESIAFLTNDVSAGRIKSFYGKVKNKLGLFLIDGRAGWTFLEPATCLLEFPKSSLFIAKNLAAMQKDGIFIPENFIKVPLELSKCGPVLLIQTKDGIKRFLLDTGSSHSVYRKSNEQQNNLSLDLTLENYNLGTWDFLPYPITSSLEIDGILGIDFFKTRAICFDYPGKSIYVHKTKTKPTAWQSLLTFFTL